MSIMSLFWKRAAEIMDNIIEIVMLILMSTFKIARRIIYSVGIINKGLKLKISAMEFTLSELIFASILKLKI